MDYILFHAFLPDFSFKALMGSSLFFSTRYFSSEFQSRTAVMGRNTRWQYLEIRSASSNSSFCLHWWKIFADLIAVKWTLYLFNKRYCEYKELKKKTFQTHGVIRYYGKYFFFSFHFHCSLAFFWMTHPFIKQYIMAENSHIWIIK